MGTTKKSTERFGITTLEDISALILQSHDLGETLANIVALVAKRMRTEVCSIYLMEEDGETLRLMATKGLSRRAVGRVTLKVGEGLTGLAAEEKRVVAILEPEQHPRFRYFKETKEERFHSFLGLPLFDRQTPIGVVAIQTRDSREFSQEEISALSTIAFQVSAIVINARLLDSIRKKEEESSRFARELASARQSLEEQKDAAKPLNADAALRGNVAYPGVVSGSIHLLDESFGFADLAEEEGRGVEEEQTRLDTALNEVRIQTLFLEKQVSERLGEDDAAIFHTHLMILEDRSFHERINREIEQGLSAPHALKRVVGEYLAAFERMDDPYLRERAADMEDIGKRLLAQLLGRERHVLQLNSPGILVARELLPSEMASLDHSKLLGIVTEAAEKNSHAVIMAKSLGIPALVGVRGLVKAAHSAELLILDANSGCLYLDPPQHIVEEYRRLEVDLGRELHRLDEFRDLPGLTRDGETITLRANIGLLSDIEIACRNGADGVGLYRTEFPYMARTSFPDRKDQYQLYRKVIEGFDGHPVTIRTLDIGGDKVLPYFTPPREDNPFMGWRSVRFSLDHRDIFRTQIEAILQAGLHGPVKMLFPMISTLEEVRACREVVAEACANLAQEGIYATESIPVGIMIEVPAAVQMIEHLAREVDFFALGTNDLIQYMLAADRNNPLVRKYYDPLHPAVLQTLHRVAQVARKQQKGLCLCGEMASDPINLMVLVGMGVREFSMPAPFIPRTKAFLRTLPLETATKAAKAVLKMTDHARIRSYLERKLKSLPPL